MSGHTHIHTYTQDNYNNPRCACAPRVNRQHRQRKQVASLAGAHWMRHYSARTPSNFS